MRSFGNTGMTPFGQALGLAVALPTCPHGTPLAPNTRGHCGCVRQVQVHHVQQARGPIFAQQQVQVVQTQVRYTRNSRGQAVKKVTLHMSDGTFQVKKYKVVNTQVTRDWAGKPILSTWFWSDGTQTQKNL